MIIFKENIFSGKSFVTEDFSINYESLFLNNTIFLDDNINLYFVLDGKYTLTYDENIYQLKKHDIVVMASKDLYILNTFTKKNLLLKIELSRNFLNKYGINLIDSIILYSDENLDLINRLYNLILISGRWPVDNNGLDNKFINYFVSTINMITEN